jgi:hypothetical protein
LPERACDAALLAYPFDADDDTEKKEDNDKTGYG